VKTLFRTSFLVSHTYYAQADWETPGPYGVAEYHAIELRVRCLGAHTRANARRPVSCLRLGDGRIRLGPTGVFG
jgi:hypothetical protein